METATGEEECWGLVQNNTSWCSCEAARVLTESVSVPLTCIVNESHVTESCEGWIDNDLTELKHKNRSTREYQVIGDSRMDI